MPVFFPEAVAHNNPSRPILDATNRQVKGFGLFDSKANRDTLDASIRTGGFLAVTQENSSYKAFIFTGSTWDDSGSWTELGTQPGGNKFAVLAKLSDVDFDYDWTETPQFESVSMVKSSNSTFPSINLFRSRGSDSLLTPTQSGDVIAQIAFFGADTGGNQATAGKMVFTQVESAGSGPGVSTKMELFVGNNSGDVAALTLNEERVVSISRQSTAPAPVLGGIYASSNNELFFGVDN